MKPLSETLTELGIAFTFPIEITNANGNRTYYEDSDGYWGKREYDANGNPTYYENSTGYWCKYEYDDKGNETYYEVEGVWHRYEYDAKGKHTYYENSVGYWCKYEYNAKGRTTYYENSSGVQRGTPKSSKTCEGKVVEVDGIKYKLKAL